LTVLGTGTKTIVTLYDLTLLQYPDGFSTTDLWYWRYLQPHLLRRVDKIVAISHNTARDLERLYGLGQERVRVIYPPAHPRFRPLEAAEVARIRSQYGLPAQTIMHIGSFGPKKNLDTLVRAFARVADSFAGSLVFVGGPYRPGYDLPLKRLIAELGLPERVIFTGIAPAEDLPGLINAATLMVFPSLHEGFGLVAVEAMACGAPLIVSPGGALQEVVGDEGLIMPDPRDSEQLAQMMGELCRDEERRRALSDYGLTRAKIFAPETIARQTLNLYQEVRDG
jgi:glycosyltransferase involved in cell wall biosynthesis